MSKYSWRSYKRYFSGKERYERCAKEKGGKEAVFWELFFSLSNPLLEDKIGSDTSLGSLIDKKSKLISKIMNSGLSGKVEHLFRLQDEGQEKWISDVVMGLDSNANSQAVKKIYDEAVRDQLHLVMDTINQLQRMVTNRDAQK